MKCSIIIAAHNEAENLRKHIPSILNQKNVEFEVIVINDRSVDNTQEVLESFKNDRLNVLIIENLQKGISGKKHALTKGIEKAQYDNLLFTDADCKPNSDNWAIEMASKLKESDLVLGISQYENNYSFLSSFIQFDTLLTAVQYWAAAKLGVPYMGVGRNIAYKKSLFITNKGFESHQAIVGGDDDLFVGEVAKNAKVSSSVSYESQTTSTPKKTWKEFFNQKRRHLTVGMKYSFKNKIIGGLLNQLWLWGFILCLLTLTFIPFQDNIYIKAYIGLKVFWWFVLFLYKLKFNFKINPILFPILDFLYLFYFLITGLSVIFVKKRTWN